MLTEADHELSQIVARAKQGESAAFSEIYSRYASLILRYLYVRLREQETAQDLTQEVFMRVLKSIGGFEYRGEKSFLGWLYTIASNILIGQARRRRAIATPLDETLELVDPSSQEAVSTVDDRLTLQDAMRQLTDDQQQVLTLRYFSDMTNQEIANVTGRTEGAVKALQHRALQSLQQIMTREMGDPLRARAVGAAGTFDS